ncbi:hypothetical protein SAMN02910315_01375 [Methanobrevibacter millerae]|uniref:Uncharacterized protein n=1 Tax=Methanobrevibacter millerae TaxID=230361 RepID=A0A1G5WE83_9EURY|nr:hypothetical protein SAMN02910315_01375 [Methanobrevibacter millerae]
MEKTASEKAKKTKTKKNERSVFKRIFQKKLNVSNNYVNLFKSIN